MWSATLSDKGIRTRGGQQLQHLLAHPIQVGSLMGQYLGCNTLALADQGEQDVLGADVVVAELLRFAKAQLRTFLARGVNGMWLAGAC